MTAAGRAPTAGTAYVDTSAIVKLLVREPESTALAEALDRFDAVATSLVAEVEVARVVLRAGISQRAAIPVLDPFARVPLTAEVVRMARTLEPPELRALDAIHLASALSLGLDDLVFVAYDRRLLTAAGAAGLATAAPGV